MVARAPKEFQQEQRYASSTARVSEPDIILYGARTERSSQVKSVQKH